MRHPLTPTPSASALPARLDSAKPGDRLRKALLSLSTLLCLAVTLCYSTRADGGAAVTIIPAWLWPAPGLLLAALAGSRSRRRAVVGVCLLWLLYLVFIPEEPGSLVRIRNWPSPKWLAARSRGQALRVITLNCAGGTAEAAAEVVPYRPDIVLLQESPGHREVEQLARRLFGPSGTALVGLDASIIVNGRLIPAPLPRSLGAYFVQAHTRLTSGIETEVISLRLTPALVRLDLWSPDCWREQTVNRRVRRDQLRAVAQRVSALPPGAPLILGGDFNAPAGDAIFRLLQTHLRDTFQDGGMGWGDTIVNDIPLQRIDQVWISPFFRAGAVVARKTRNSDHRMVICDLLLPSGLARTP